MTKAEADIFSRYLIGKPINAKGSALYYSSLTLNTIEGNVNQEKLVIKVLHSPWKLPYYDAALALLKPDHLLRQKLHRMFAILETQPEFADLFLGKEFPKSYFITIMFTGMRAILRAVIGLLIIPYGNIK